MTEQQAVLSWLKDAHAMEVGALPTLQHHADAAQNYPEVREKLLQHHEQTRRHAELIGGCLERLGTNPSALKETVGTAFGKVTGLVNLPTKDPVVKNALGDYAAEHFEIASYKSLIAGAEKAGDLSTADVCRQILQEEEEMAGWLGGHIPTMTQKFLDEQTGESESSDGALSKVGQTVTELGEKGKDAATNVGPKNALLAGGALLAGAGAAMLIGQALRRNDDKNSEQTEWNDLGDTNLGSAEYGAAEADSALADGTVIDDMVVDDIAVDGTVIDAVMETDMGLDDSDLDDSFVAASDPLGAEPLEIETDAATMQSLDDSALLADLAADLPLEEETGGLVYTEVWLEPGLYSGFGPSYDSAGDPVGQEVASRLTQHGQVDASNIEITVENGDVLLEGTVADEETKRLVGEAVQTVTGVNQIENMLQVQTVQTGMGQDSAGQSSMSQDGASQGSTDQSSSGGNDMSEFEHSTTIDASPDDVYAFMSKVENLPKYLPTTHSAQPQQGDRVRVQGEAQGHEYDADGFFRTDKDAHRIEWGADEQYYSGWLEVTGQGENSTMTVHLSFSGGPPAGEGDAPSDESNNAPNRDEIQEGLVKSLESIKNFVEEGRSGGKEEPSAAT